MLTVNSEVELNSKEVISLDTCNDEIAFNIAMSLGVQMFDAVNYKIKGINNEMKAVS